MLVTGIQMQIRILRVLSLHWKIFDSAHRKVSVLFISTYLLHELFRTQDHLLIENQPQGYKTVLAQYVYISTSSASSWTWVNCTRTEV